MLLIKAGGGKNINWDYIAEDIALLVKKQPLVIVHGANAKRDEIAQKLQAPTQYIHSPSGYSGVYTDEAALEILCMVYAGLVNKQIVAKLLCHGVQAVGLSGADGQLWQGKRKKFILGQIDDKVILVKETHTGVVTQINTHLINLLVGSGYTPVITQPAISGDGELINTDNDRNVVLMAQALKISKIVILLEAPGLLSEFPDERSRIPHLNTKDLDNYQQGAGYRMKKKLLGLKAAAASGVKTIYLGDGRIKHPIIKAMSGNGTTIDDQEEAVCAG